MQAVVLAGGQGQRLRPFTSVLPKPLMPIGDRPILDIILRQLYMHGVTDVTIALNYLGSLIQSYVDQSEIGQRLNIHYHWEEKPLGTAGAIGTIKGLDAPFFVMNGDILTSLDYSAMYEAHMADDADLTVGTVTTDVRIELGVLNIDPSRHVIGYDEKPTMTYAASMGIYVYSPRILDRIKPGEYLDAPNLVLGLIADGKKVLSHAPDCEWIDIGNQGQHEHASSVYLADPSVFLPGFEAS
ncbi:sugar phosphate nucleotidyltransferase [Ruegeria marina]|uniref:Nucleotidyl transferase n=1 Tax=Ruegeria marina TaxID=639004 RepID=A0A1G6VKL0_9RHOB|nr:sugar phosphate nucleotidyltransferase [Ruegeria marina]SDD54098.1 Nucleotidyl transferase [Ruegeria marina]